jgi:endonuclease YncB( thermonuclease family)
MYECQDVRVMDGDTLEATVKFPWGVMVRKKFRAVDYDACESSKRRRSVKVTDEEVKIGKKATQEFKKLLSENELIIDTDKGKTDLYGRPLVIFYYEKDDGSVSSVREWMESKKFLRKNLEE